MLNRIQIEGVVLKTWQYAGTPYARLVNRPDPGAGQSDMIFVAKLPANVPTSTRVGDLLRMHGRFFNRRRDEEADDYVGEVHAETVVLIARNQLRKSRREQTPDAEEMKDAA